MRRLAAAVQADQAERRSTWRLFLAPAAAAVLIAAVWAAGVWGTDGLRLGSLPGPISLRLGVPYASSACLSSNHSREVQKFVGDEEAFGNCTVPLLDVKGLEDYGCKVLNDSCFDQHRIIVYNPPDDLTLHHNFVDTGWVPTWVPGWTRLNKTGAGTEGVENWAPQVRKNSSEDRPDQLDPLFSSCYTPLVWSSPYHISFAEFFLNSFIPLWDMQIQRKLFDRQILLAPVMDGYRTQPFMENLLRPYTNKFITHFNDISSREHMYEPKYPRCFKKVAICGLKGMYKDRPEPTYVDPETNITMPNGDKNWTWFAPAKAGKNLVDFYREEGALPKPAQPKGKDTLQIVVGNRTAGYRMFLDLPEFLDQCNAWTPPPPYKRARCLALTFSPHNFLEDLAVLQQTDILVTHHGATANHALFMPWGSSLVEVRPHGFPEIWAQTYVPSVMRTENEIFYWFVKVEGEGSWEPAQWEKDSQPNHIYEIERNTRLRWEQWAPMFSNITAVQRSKEKYEQLQYPFDVRMVI